MQQTSKNKERRFLRWACVSTASFLLGFQGAMGNTAFLHGVDLSVYKDEVGYNQLRLRMGELLPLGDGLALTMVEPAIADEPNGNLPVPGHGDYQDVAITDKSGWVEGYTSHATGVAILLFGNDGSMCPKVSEVSIYRGEHWLTSGFLHALTDLEPDPSSAPIVNHSWATSESPDAREDITRRVDYVIDRDKVIMLTGALNNPYPERPLPHADLMVQGYNMITGGLSTGKHAHGGTTFDVAGRIKPDLVVPGIPGAPLTSFVVPVLSSAAGTLYQAADLLPSSKQEARMPQSIKAIMMAGATKHEFPEWLRTATQPIDLTFGAGELNIYHSMQILAAGRQQAGAEYSVTSTGWDFGYANQDASLYFFDVPDSHTNLFSAVLTWHRKVLDNLPGEAFGALTTHLADLNLTLFRAEGFALGEVVDESRSQIDNVEHIYQRDLAPGRYALRVVNESGNAEQFGLAWRTTSPETPIAAIDKIGTRIDRVRIVNSHPEIGYKLLRSANLESNSWLPVEEKQGLGFGYELIWLVDSPLEGPAFYRLELRNLSP